MAFPVKQIQTLEEQLHIIEEAGKTPSERRTEVSKQLGLPQSTLNTIIAKKMKIRKDHNTVHIHHMVTVSVEQVLEKMSLS
jgi:hypothetical protein